jgi:ATP-dependent DNA helicase HFM1/MER3
MTSTLHAKGGALQAPQGGQHQDLHLRYQLSSATFKTLCTVSKAPQRRVILETACHAAEFGSFALKQAERNFFREINDHSPIPYPVRQNLSEPWHKVFLLVQVELQGKPWPNKISSTARKELMKEAGTIHRVLDRVLRCMVDILGERLDGRGVSVALDVLRSVKSKVWEGSQMELLQVDEIGQVKVDRLVQAGVKTIKQLASLEFYHIERLLSRNPPFGQRVLHQLAGFPILQLKVDVVDRPVVVQRGIAAPPNQSNTATHPTSRGSPCLARLHVSYENQSLPLWKGKTPWATIVIEAEDGTLLWFWRGSVKKLEGGRVMTVCLDARPRETIKVAFACEDIVGTLIRESFVW